MDFIKPGIVDWKRVKKEDQMSKMAAKRLQEVSFSTFDVFDKNANVVNLCLTRCWVIATMPLSLGRS